MYTSSKKAYKLQTGIWKYYSWPTSWNTQELKCNMNIKSQLPDQVTEAEPGTQNMENKINQWELHPFVIYL